MKVFALNHGMFAVTPKKEFTLLPKATVYEKTAGTMQFAICPFLIELNGEYILLDAGFGLDTAGKPIILQLVADLGIDCDKITKILLSHLHKDHMDGIGHCTNGRLIPNFPNAQLYLQQRELDFALGEIQNPSYNQTLLTALKNAPNVNLMQDDEGLIDNNIVYEVNGGHTPYHQSFWITDGQETIFYGADNLPKKGYWQSRFAYKTDFDGRKALEMRQKWAIEAPQKHWKVLFYHDQNDNIVQL